jgi:DNA-binding NtrC family response regulator
MRLLIVGTLGGQLTIASKIAMDKGAAVTHADSNEQALAVLRSGRGADLLFVDVNLDIRDLVDRLDAERIHVPIVACGVTNDARAAVRAIHAGAKEYIPLPPDPDLIAAVLAAVATDSRDMIYRDDAMAAVVKLAQQIAGSDASVLITGESGTGKEVYARFIRDHSARADKPFVAINCAAIPENMLEATLFGYEKGAFTGALGAHAGKFEQAQHGTLLLDEISEMDLGLQAKILRVLQEREVERLGSSRTINLDVRVIATSNRNLAEEASAGRFRADLYYRLNVMSLRLPALRERSGDILPLAHRAMQACARGSQASLALSPEAERKLLRHDWPGNARELTNIVQRAAWLAVGGLINAADLDINIPADAAQADAIPQPPPPAPAAAQEAGLDRDLKERERELIFATLRVTGGSRKLAAERLGISPRTLRHKLQQLKAAGISVPRLPNSQFATA